ncbi:hypothetical protein Tco_0034735, partial [Tanacetum coccineum]
NGLNRRPELEHYIRRVRLAARAARREGIIAGAYVPEPSNVRFTRIKTTITVMCPKPQVKGGSVAPNKDPDESSETLLLISHASGNNY